MGPRAALSVKGRALRYLAQREHSRAELARKLAKHVEDGPDACAADLIAQALDELTARGLLSEERAAQALVTARAGRFGNLKLRHQLRSRGVEPAAAAAALETVVGDELARAWSVWQRKYGEPPLDSAAYSRQARFLMSRGFASDTVRRVLRGQGSEPDNC